MMMGGGVLVGESQLQAQTARQAWGAAQSLGWKWGGWGQVGSWSRGCPWGHLWFTRALQDKVASVV